MKMFGRVVAHSYGIRTYLPELMDNAGIKDYDVVDNYSLEFEVEPSQLQSVADAVFKSGTLGIAFAYGTTCIPVAKFGSRS